MADSKRVDGGSQEMEKNEMKKIEQTEGANLIINEKPDGSPKDIVSELSVEEQGDNTDVKTAESTKVQTGVENTNNIGTELAEDGQIIQKSTTLESQDQSSEAAKEEEAKSTDKVEEAGSTDKVEEAKSTDKVEEAKSTDEVEEAQGHSHGLLPGRRSNFLRTREGSGPIRRQSPQVHWPGTLPRV